MFAMPDLGEGLTEAEIIGWRVAVGDEVTINQIVVEVETAKAVVELPSPYAGWVAELRHGPGEVVAVGTPIIVIAGEPAAAEFVRHETPPPDMSRQPVLVGYGVHHSSAVRRPRRIITTTASAQSGVPTQVNATPPVRQLARQLGVDLATLSPTGNHGRVTRADVLAARAATATPSAAAPSAPPTAETRVPVKGIRKHIAEAMTTSAFTAPHVTEWLTVDVTRTMRLVKELRAELDDVRVTPLTVVARAALLSLIRHPDVNARWDGVAQEIVRYSSINLGIAVAGPRGLIVPNIPAAETLSFRELAKALTELVGEARANRTELQRLRGGTFTITNIGVFGVDGATPIINPGEAAILCLGQIRQRPWQHRGKLVVRWLTTLSLSFDHRLIDGELGSRFLIDIGRLLERPSLALSW